MKKVILLSILISQVLFFIFLPVWLELTNYLHPLVVGIVWIIISFLTLFIICWIKNEKIYVSTRILHSLVLLYSIGLLILLFLRPNDQHYGTINLIPFATIRLYLSGHADFLIAFYNLGANIGLFIPFGLYYGYIKRNPAMKQLLIISLCSISIIEGLQFLTKRGSLDIDDLILNVLGICIGYFVLPFFQKVMIIQEES